MPCRDCLFPTLLDIIIIIIIIIVKRETLSPYSYSESLLSPWFPSAFLIYMGTVVIYLLPQQQTPNYFHFQYPTYLLFTQEFLSCTGLLSLSAFHRTYWYSLLIQMLMFRFASAYYWWLNSFCSFSTAKTIMVIKFTKGSFNLLYAIHIILLISS
jgi:hypothetical protein